MAERKRKGGGGKLTRSETVTVRLDPITRFAAELAATQGKHTLSSFLEQAARVAVALIKVTTQSGEMSALELADRAWTPDEYVRFRRVAHDAPHLLPPEKRALIEAWAFFMKETNLLLARAGHKALQVIEDADGHNELTAWHISDGVMDKIAAAVRLDGLDYAGLKSLAVQELADRGLLERR